jgi:hypothetical protein
VRFFAARRSVVLVGYVRVGFRLGRRAAPPLAMHFPAAVDGLEVDAAVGADDGAPGREPLERVAVVGHEHHLGHAVEQRSQPLVVRVPLGRHDRRAHLGERLDQSWYGIVGDGRRDSAESEQREHPASPRRPQ